MFTAGDLVVYGGEGVCRVDGVGTIATPGGDKGRAYYTLSPLYRSGQVMTPVDTGVLMRPAMTAAEAAAFLEQLPQLPPEEPVGDTQRTVKEHYHTVVTSYDCRRMAAMIKYICRRRLWARQHNRKVSQLDERYLRRAEEQLYGELAAALPLERQTVCQYIQQYYPAWPEA